MGVDVHPRTKEKCVTVFDVADVVDSRLDRGALRSAALSKSPSEYPARRERCARIELNVVFAKAKNIPGNKCGSGRAGAAIFSSESKRSRSGGLPALTI
jgi:hypothetical protein